MTLLQQISNPYIASLTFWLLYGLTFCASSFLPYIKNYVVGIGMGFKKRVVIKSIYKSERILTYTTIYEQFKRLAHIKIRKVEETCTKCGKCTRVCPPRVTAVYEKKGDDDTAPDCPMLPPHRDMPRRRMPTPRCWRQTNLQFKKLVKEEE